VQHARPRRSLDDRVLGGRRAWAAVASLGLVLVVAGLAAGVVAIVVVSAPGPLRVVLGVAAVWGLAVGGTAVRSGLARRRGR
jgi:hypothetical protein